MRDKEGSISDHIVDLQHGIDGPLEVIDTNGAISSKSGLVLLTKAGVAAMTLAAPTTVTDDRKILRIISTTAQAHTVTTPAASLNAGTTATFAAAVGSSLALMAYGGKWYSVSTLGVTLT